MTLFISFTKSFEKEAQKLQLIQRILTTSRFRRTYESEEHTLKLKGQIETLRFEIESLQDQIQNIKRQNADLESNNLSLCESYKFTKEQLIRTRNELSDTTKLQEQAVLQQKNLREDLAQKISMLQEDFDEKMRKTSADWEMQSVGYEQQIAQYRARLDEQQRAIEGRLKNLPGKAASRRRDSSDHCCL